jgi:inner membrane protein
MLLFSALSLLPDADVIGMHFGVPYGAPSGHRGATHSLVAALLVALVVAWLARRERTAKVFVFVLLVVASHGCLDAMTDGGRGVAFLWPFTDARSFFPWRPIPVAPIGVRLLSARGLHAVLFEIAAFAPFWLYAIWPRRRRRREPRESGLDAP